jgi:hypothetical protein
MITKEAVEEQITKLKVEKVALQASHDKLIREHQARVEQVQQIASGNISRMQQITGAISQLTELLNGQNGQKPPSEEQPK